MGPESFPVPINPEDNSVPSAEESIVDPDLALQDRSDVSLDPNEIWTITPNINPREEEKLINLLDQWDEQIEH